MQNSFENPDAKMFREPDVKKSCENPVMLTPEIGTLNVTSPEKVKGYVQVASPEKVRASVQVTLL